VRTVARAVRAVVGRVSAAVVGAAVLTAIVAPGTARPAESAGTVGTVRAAAAAGAAGAAGPATETGVGDRDESAVVVGRGRASDREAAAGQGERGRAHREPLGDLHGAATG